MMSDSDSSRTITRPDTAAGPRAVPRLAHNGPVNAFAPTGPTDPPEPSDPSGPADPLAAFTALRAPEGTALLTELRSYDPAQELATATRLRRSHPAALVSAALGQARLRQRAVAKFGAEDAYRMFFTPNGVEQATRTSVATYRAGRFAAAGVRSVADLCCGIGGDAIALARAGISVLAVDRDPLTAEVARANAAALGLDALIEVRCADVTEIDTAAVRRRLRRPGPARRARQDLRPGGVLPAALLGDRRPH